MAAKLLELNRITKRFGPVTALDDVSLELRRGEVLGLIGENGAGKSTLMKILGGVFTPTSGVIALDGRAVNFANAGQSIHAGIAFVHQELNSFSNLDVAANILIGRELRRGPVNWFVDDAACHEHVQPLLDRLQADFFPTTPVLHLSIAQRQLLEIARALSLNARVIIMDEPTSSLTASESERLLEIVRQLRAEGVSTIFITHRLNEVVEIADRVVVLRDGRVVGQLDTNEITPESMIGLMIGRALKNIYRPPAARRVEMGLEVRDLKTTAYPEEAVTLTVRRGEILGLAGLIGAGRSELARAIFGIDPIVAGEIKIDGRKVAVRTPQEAMEFGLALVPEDRKQSGLLLDDTLSSNVALGNYEKFSSKGFVSEDRLVVHTKDQIAAFDIHAQGPEARMTELSGGNQQKAILARWLPRQPKVLICDEPTRGVDVGARHDIYAKLRQASDAGAAILLISSDMEEVLGVSDRIAVMHEGRISGFLERDQFSEENVLHLAVGRPAREK